MTALWIPLAAYLLGSVPVAFLLARRTYGVDVRVAGSGNVGAANVLRTTSAPLAVLVALLDFGKGSAAVWLAGELGGHQSARAAAGVAAVLGHIYPVWLGFRGGKGVAVAAGVFGMLAPAAALIAAVVFTGVVWATRYVSLGSLMAALALPPLVDATGGSTSVTYAAAVTAAAIVIRHRGNLRRLVNRTERRLGERA
ncbi:MAG TPA: glycerol-3-phosphate 1-O-acyltransferase PlsY [Vicinamibacterales bacterium]|nr:glycerol-3-phosphate 1-O-acyltransferase PlsY [Vicinamibacterales bacterium]